MPQPAAQKPISQIDKLKLMIIRIGDEMRHNRDDNLLGTIIKELQGLIEPHISLCNYIGYFPSTASKP